MKKVKKEVKRDFYFTTILKKASSGSSLVDIAKDLGFSKQRMNYYVKQLKEKGYLVKAGYGTWNITEKGKQALNKEVKNITSGTITNLHALNIKVPIIEGKISLSRVGGYKQLPLRGWTPEYKKISGVLGGLTFKNNNNKSISVQVWSRDIKKLREVHGIVLRVLMFSQSYFKGEGVLLDIYDAQVTSIHLSTRVKDLDKVLNKGEKIEVLLNRKAEKILPKDKDRESKAWIDSSPFNGVETDDLEYKQNFLMMPERVAQMEKWGDNIALYNKNIELHLEVLNKMSKTLDKIDNRMGECK